MSMRLAVLTLLALLAGPVWADQAEAEAAVAKVLFEADMENASFKARSDGFVDILFGAAVSDETYIRLVERLRATPGIKGVLPGKSTSNYCPIR